MVTIIRDDSYLAHHGVKGMKWGIRNPETLARYRQAKETGKAIATMAAPLIASKISKQAATEVGYEVATRLLASGMGQMSVAAVGMTPYVAIGAGIVASVYTKKAINAYKTRKAMKK